MDVKRGAFRRLDCEVIVAQTVETAATMRRDADRQRLMSLCVLFCLWHLWHFFSHVSFAQMRQLDVLKQKLSEAQKFIKSQEPNMLKDPDESEIMIDAMCQSCIEEAIEDSENDMRQRLKNSRDVKRIRGPMARKRDLDQTVSWLCFSRYVLFSPAVYVQKSVIP